MDTKNLYQISEVAHTCNVSRSTILRMEEKGLLHPYYVSAESGRGITITMILPRLITLSISRKWA